MIKNKIPILTLPFNKGIVSNKVTCVRSGTSTIINKFGKIEVVDENIPRINYDLKGNCLGLLIETSSTNYLEQSWSPSTTNDWTVEEGSADGSDTGINGVNPLNTFPGGYNSVYYNNLNYPFKISRTFNGLLDGINTFSFLARVTGDAFQVFAGDDSALTELTMSREWALYQLPVNIVGGSMTLSFRITNGDVAGIEICAMQLEQLPFATSWIFTDGTPMSRSVDNVSVSIPTGLLKTRGTFKSAFDLTGFDIGTNQFLFSLGNSDDTGEWVSAYLLSEDIETVRIKISQNEAFIAETDPIAMSLNTQYEISVPYDSQDTEQLYIMKALFNSVDTGAFINNDTSLLENQSTVISLGNNWGSTTKPLNGHIKNFYYYPAFFDSSESV